MRDLPVGLPSELVPLSWLIGVWEGSGVLEYKIGEESVSATFGHRISFSHDGLPHLNYSSYTWLEPEVASRETDAGAFAGSSAPAETDAAGVASALPHGLTPALPPEMMSDEKTPLVTETGYWRLSRHQGDGDPGPGMLPGTGGRPFTSAAAVETLRNRDGGFDIEVTLVHPGGVAELYLGQVKGPRIDLATDAVLRTAGAKPYAAATRLYGLVDNHLLWAWDIAALGQDLRTHTSGRLTRVQ
ncbi:FABP family protein [Cryobacterium sp. Y29]|uniref:FABP family protein n=1 Tax=Cryobacterium sp. Y29 TaxID=2048285 RepID=UPI000CE5052B|nr:FABP family protein [Cryobacterium sp. Y29]